MNFIRVATRNVRSAPVLARLFSTQHSARGSRGAWGLGLAARAGVQASRASVGSARRSMFVQTKTTPNPLSLIFLPGKAVLGEGDAMQFKSLKEAQASPLAREIFKIDDVTGVFFGADFVSVSITSEADWNVLKPQIFAAITDFYVSGKPVIVETAQNDNPDTVIDDEDDEVVALIKELIETRIRAFVQEDGGDIVFRKFEDGIVYVELQGSCVGCPSSSVTLKNGIENMLMHYVPEVDGVENLSADGSPADMGGDDEIDPELQTTSAEELRKLEEGLARVQANKK